MKSWILLSDEADAFLIYGIIISKFDILRVYSVVRTLQRACVPLRKSIKIGIGSRSSNGKGNERDDKGQASVNEHDRKKV